MSIALYSINRERRGTAASILLGRTTIHGHHRIDTVVSWLSVHAQQDGDLTQSQHKGVLKTTSELAILARSTIKRSTKLVALLANV